MVNNVKGQRAIIMGGTSGIGLAAARMLTEAGAEAVVTGRDKAKLDSALQQLGPSAQGAQLDAASYEDLKAFYSRQGSFDHLVIAVSGAKGAGNFRELSLNELREGFDAKFWPQVMAAQLSLDTLSSNGSITFLTAISARSSAPGIAGLAAINAALESMVPILALELAPIRVNAVSPGVVDTPWWNWMPEEQRVAALKFYELQAPVGKVGQPDDIAKAICYLIDNTFVTGTVLEVDGGLRLK
ncbi:short-chain dehydrogenase [Gordoniibacillus kamchatkensis]|uniref:Short-chain dehydrogenase n=1 Tax=Gordoniibacillus kamchatkensis TaxID=1590651 RepID=A0ABR5AFN4_9BACL|nr:SDR family oxidoreductase [Paenibacillus sp. VKM B-2647]KIL39866.1 short-chain dehydrogenase [Paenibacillus sp. VKM B-2647]